MPINLLDPQELAQFDSLQEDITTRINKLIGVDPQLKYLNSVVNAINDIRLKLAKNYVDTSELPEGLEIAIGSGIKTLLGCCCPPTGATQRQLLDLAEKDTKPIVKETILFLRQLISLIKKGNDNYKKQIFFSDLNTKNEGKSLPPAENKNVTESSLQLGRASDISALELLQKTLKNKYYLGKRISPNKKIKGKYSQQDNSMGKNINELITIASLKYTHFSELPPAVPEKIKEITEQLDISFFEVYDAANSVERIKNVNQIIYNLNQTAHNLLANYLRAESKATHIEREEVESKRKTSKEREDQVTLYKRFIKEKEKKDSVSRRFSSPPLYSSTPTSAPLPLSPQTLSTSPSTPPPLLSQRNDNISSVINPLPTPPASPSRSIATSPPPRPPTTPPPLPRSSTSPPAQPRPPTTPPRQPRAALTAQTTPPPLPSDRRRTTGDIPQLYNNQESHQGENHTTFFTFTTTLPTYPPSRRETKGGSSSTHNPKPLPPSSKTDDQDVSTLTTDPKVTKY